MNRSKNVFTNDTLVQHDSILVVISFPRHECDFEVTSQSQLAILGGITFGKNIPGFNPVSLVADRTQIDSRALVRFTELGYDIFFYGIFKTYKFFIFRTIVANTNRSGIDKLDNAIALGRNLRTRIANQLTLDTRSHNRSFGTQ